MILSLQIVAHAPMRDSRFMAAIVVEDLRQVVDLSAVRMHGVEEPVTRELEL